MRQMTVVLLPTETTTAVRQVDWSPYRLGVQRNCHTLMQTFKRPVQAIRLPDDDDDDDGDDDDRLSKERSEPPLSANPHRDKKRNCLCGCVCAVLSDLMHTLFLPLAPALPLINVLVADIAVATTKHHQLQQQQQMKWQR